MTVSATPARRESDVVSLQQRLHYTQVLRVLLALGVVAYRMALPDLVGGSLARLGTGAVVLLTAAAAGELIWRRTRRARWAIFGGLLLLDGVLLAAAVAETGGGGSAIRYLIIVHVVATTLVGSYRTGLKLALWHSLLMFITYNAALTGLTPFWPPPQSLDYADTIGFAGVLTVLAMATATFSAVNERELRRRRVDLAALTAMCDELAQGAEPPAVAEILLRNVAETFDFRRALLVGARGAEVAVLASTSDCGPRPLAIGDDSVIGQAWALGTTQLRRTLDPDADASVAALLPEAANLIVMPLVADGAPIGALVVEDAGRHRHAISRRVVATAEQFAAHGALALRNAWLLEDVRRFADSDGLTQIPNRRTFDARLTEELGRAGRNQQRMALIMVDIDHFKSLNDTHGHQVGDAVLKEVAGVLHGGVRDFDLAARYGGEEFALILPGAGAAEAKVVGERLRTAIANADTDIPVTVSMGVAAYPMNAATAGELIEAADKALYMAKKNGRNRIATSRRRISQQRLAVVA